LIEPKITGCGRLVSAPIRGEIKAAFSRHDYMHSVMKRCNGEPVRRIQTGLRGNERPGANARVCHSRLETRKQYKQQ
jgi:hypothetical protein